MSGENVQEKFEADMRILEEAAKTFGDAFRVKVLRRSTNTVGAVPVHICSFEDVTRAQLAMPENWLRPVCGGTGTGALQLTISTMADPSKGIVMMLYAFEGQIPATLNLKITQIPTWDGPRLSYPPVKLEIPVNTSSGGNTATADAPRRDPGNNTPNISASDYKIRELERELAESKARTHQAELERVRLESDAKAAAIQEQGRREAAELRASLKALEAKLDKPAVAPESPLKPFVELLPAFLASQERQAAERVRAEERERERRKEERDEAQKREDRRMEDQRRTDEREREDRKAAREEQQRREERLEQQRRDDRERDERREDARRAEALETQKLMLARPDPSEAQIKQAEAMSAMSGMVTQNAMQMLELTRAASGGDGEHPIVSGIKAVMAPFEPKPFNGVQQQTQQQIPANTQTKTQEVKPTQQAATDAKPDTFVADIVAMVKAKTDVTVVATKFVKEGKDSEALGQLMAHEEVDNDLRRLFVQIMGGAWFAEPANMEYAAALAKKLLHVGIGQNVFPPQIAEEYGIPLEECGFNTEEVRQLKVRIAAEAAKSGAQAQA